MSVDAVARFGQNDNVPKVEHQSASKEGFTLDWCMEKMLVRPRLTLFASYGRNKGGHYEQ